MDVKEIINDDGTGLIEIKSNKTRAIYTISKGIEGFSLFSIFVAKGRKANVLDTRFTSSKDALAAVKKHISKQKLSPAIARDKYYMDNHG